jgi:FKBP-type peptidyl-prolyl cis-trans isomerase
MIIWVLIVVLVVGGLIYITNNHKNTMPEEKITKAGDMISVNYTGSLENGTVFDSNVDPKFSHVEPFQFTLGAGQVIPGWDNGLLGMKVGEKRHLVIPPADAYGADGRPPVIPPNSTLIFDVELLAIK